VSSGRQFGRTVGLSGGADHRCRVRARDGECLDTAVVMASAGCSGSESRPAVAWTSLHVTSPAVSGVDDTAWVHILLAAIQHRNFGGEGYSTHRRADGCTKFGGFGGGLLEDPVFCHEGVILLLPVGNSWRQGSDVPVDVSVALHAA